LQILKISCTFELFKATNSYIDLITLKNGGNRKAKDRVGMLNVLIMKKILSLSMAFSFMFASSILNVDNVIAQVGIIGGGAMGSSETVSQTDDCYSGLQYSCSGSGTLCETTGGNICYQPKR